MDEDNTGNSSRLPLLTDCAAGEQQADGMSTEEAGGGEKVPMLTITPSSSDRLNSMNSNDDCLNAPRNMNNSTNDTTTPQKQNETVSAANPPNVNVANTNSAAQKTTGDDAKTTGDIAKNCAETENTNGGSRTVEQTKGTENPNADVVVHTNKDTGNEVHTEGDTSHKTGDTVHTSGDALRRNGDTLHTNKVNGDKVQPNGEVKVESPESQGSGPSSLTFSNHLLPHENSSSLRRICIEEYAPSGSSTSKYKGDWRMSLDPFSSKRWDDGQGKKEHLPRNVRRYYKTQDELITAFEELQLNVDDVMETADDNIQRAKKATFLAKLSFFCNLLLLIAKVVAAAMSGSLSVISSVVDSAVDLVSGAIMWWSGRAMKRRNIYQYPQGRTKLEPIGIIILSVVMALASVQIIRESIEKIISYATTDGKGPTFSITTIVICCATVVVKLILFLLCRRVKTPSVDALTQDHRNDVFSNTIAIGCGILGDRVLSYLDPVGAILISIYILVSWYRTGAEQIRMLSGHTARPEFMKKITWLALNHHPSILFIDTVRAFHFGNNFLVECDIVLPETMDLKSSHDIGESLQLKLERLPEVERAFVHLDYETDHSPYSEHKQV